MTWSCHSWALSQTHTSCTRPLTSAVLQVSGIRKTWQNIMIGWSETHDNRVRCEERGAYCTRDPGGVWKVGRAVGRSSGSVKRSAEAMKAALRARTGAIQAAASAEISDLQARGYPHSRWAILWHATARTCADVDHGQVVQSFWHKHA